jgi:precorrin-6B methylase 1
MIADRNDADIYLVGLGMYGLRHLTLETLDVLKRATVVYHLSNKHEELCAINRNTRDLRSVNLRPAKPADTYEDLACQVVDAAHELRPIAVAVDGNPMLFSDITWHIAAIGKEQKLRVEALPGVSCLDVLPTQLGFDPGDLGLQVFEATQLVLYNLAINPYLSTLILQVGHFSETVMFPPPPKRPGAYNRLILHLTNFFPEHHPAIFIQSAYSERVPAVVFSTVIRGIDECRDKVTGDMTLYVPRLGIPRIDAEIGAEFGLELDPKETDPCLGG